MAAAEPAPPPTRSPAKLAAQARGVDRLIGPGLALATLLLVFGLTVPTITVSRLFLFEERMSILRGLDILLAADEWPLAIIVVVFSILFPVAKIGLAARLWYAAQPDGAALKRRLRLLDFAGKWSMLDVFVAAIVVATVKVSVVSAVSIHAGIYLFGSAIVLSMVISQRIGMVARARLERTEA